MGGRCYIAYNVGKSPIKISCKPVNVLEIASSVIKKDRIAIFAAVTLANLVSELFKHAQESWSCEFAINAENVVIIEKTSLPFCSEL